MRNVIERLINLLAFLLTTTRPVTAERIRNTVAGYGDQSDEAFRRMFERDKDLLRKLGIPIVAQADTWGIEFGYAVKPDEYRLPDPGLSDDERAALWLAAQVVRIGGQPSGAEALLKLGGTRMIPAAEPLGADLGSGVDVLADLYQAVSERKLVEFTYNQKKRRAEPHGIAHRRGHWYLVGVENGEDRTYRADRITELNPIGAAGAFVRAGADAVAARVGFEPWEAGSDAPTTVRVVFDPDAAWWASRRIGPGVKADRQDDGSVEAVFSVTHVDAFIGWVLTFGAGAKVVDPVEIRDRLIARVKGQV